MSAIVGYLDFLILGALIGTIPLFVNKFFNFPKWVGLFLAVIVFIFFFFTDDGKALGSKIAIFNQSRSWDKVPKVVVSNQCAAFSKIGTNYKKWTNDDINFLKSSMNNGVNLKKLTKYEIKISQCCATYIMTKYNQDFYMEQDDVTLLMQESLNSCR